MSVVRGFLGSGGFRILHDVNTDKGSSGGPCLNDRYEVVGVHQAGMPDGFVAETRTRPRTAGTTDQAVKRNRAVPMGRILGEWQLNNAPKSSAAIARLLTTESSGVHEHPVFGRARLQTWIARSAADRGTGGIADRFLAVAGPKGSGKSFTLDILNGMLPPGEHSVLECPASDFNTMASAVEFADKYLLKPLTGDVSKLSQLANANTSDNAWLNYQFIGDLLSEMNAVRRERMVWLVLDELNDVVLPDQGQVRKLLDLLYARAADVPWLRVLLLGLEAVPVQGLNPLTFRDLLGSGDVDALAEDVADYMLRRLEGSGMTLPPDYVTGQARNEIGRAVDSLGGGINDPALLRTVADGIIRLEIAVNLRRR